MKNIYRGDCLGPEQEDKKEDFEVVIKVKGVKVKYEMSGFLNPNKIMDKLQSSLKNLQGVHKVKK